MSSLEGFKLEYKDLDEARKFLKGKKRRSVSLKEWLGREPTEEEKQIVAEMNNQ